MRWAFILMSLALPASGDTMICEGSGVTVTSPDSRYSDATCQAVRHAAALLDQCSLPPLESAIRIELVSEMKPGCTAIYHCGTGRIEVLEPPLMEARRLPEGAFSFLTIEDYFQSVVVHELAHTLFDEFPCPFESCPATNEYFAYVMQVMSLSPSDRAKFTMNSALDRTVSRDELSLIILLMAPGRFAQKAWAHVSQQNDSCAYVRQVLDGSVLLDYERF